MSHVSFLFSSAYKSCVYTILHIKCAITLCLKTKYYFNYKNTLLLKDADYHLSLSASHNLFALGGSRLDIGENAIFANCNEVRYACIGL